MAIIDTQSVPCIGVRGPRGSDGAKKLVGRKRVALVDAEGHILARAVEPANVQDRDTLAALDDGKEQWPSLSLAILDGAITAERCREWCHIPGMRHRVVEKEPDQTGVVVLERRWVVERTFGWLGHWGGLLRERAGRLDVATSRLARLASLMAARALNNLA
ncbi:transposase [Methylobacterium pseudosasicola]|uniref:transposase n=1 Tax=Methylobacterium pseudosasicola TaxID=582667 RepID=UPI001428D677|nr:transposase [Methylobacterium pseudosasicola]